MRRILPAFLISLMSVVFAEARDFPVNISRFNDMVMCKAEDPAETPIVVFIYHNANRPHEALFHVVMKNTGSQLLTAWSYREARNKKEQSAERFVYYTRTGLKWQTVGTFEIKEKTQEKEREAAQKVLDSVVGFLKSQIPEKYREMRFKEFWEGAGCTTHGPVPFWWR